MPRIKKSEPTIKGLFVNSHVNRLKEAKGEEAVRELERLYGSGVAFKNLEDVPVREEVRIIELCLQILDPALAAGPERLEEAGRLHFRNFAETRLGTVLLASLPHTPQSLKTLLLNVGSIGRSVFKHTNLSGTEQRGGVVVVMENTDYPAEHFAGFFAEWALHYGLPRGAVRTETEDSTHRYIISGF